jgi:hypothetical protein
MKSAEKVEGKTLGANIEASTVNSKKLQQKRLSNKREHLTLDLENNKHEKLLSQHGSQIIVAGMREGTASKPSSS